MVKVGTYVVIGLLCVAMAAGVFLGGPPPPPNNAPQAGDAPAPRVADLSAAEQTKLQRSRALVTEATKRAGGAPLDTKTLDGKLQTIQRVLDASADRTAPHTELEALGVVFGDALAQGLNLRWVAVVKGKSRTIAMLHPTSQNLAAPTQLFLGRQPGDPAVDVKSLYEAARLQMNAPR